MKLWDNARGSRNTGSAAAAGTCPGLGAKGTQTGHKVTSCWVRFVSLSKFCDKNTELIAVLEALHRPPEVRGVAHAALAEMDTVPLLVRVPNKVTWTVSCVQRRAALGVCWGFGWLTVGLCHRAGMVCV